ncbi:MAG: hypothetical protein ACM3JH_13160 [Acidithiobacillales bacterium]
MAHQLIGLTLCFMAAFNGAQLDSQGVPDTLGESESTVPLWVAADVAANPDGSLRADVFLPAIRRDIEAMLNLPVERGCIRVGRILIDQRNADQDRTTFAGALRSAHIVAVTRVVGSRAGFFQGIPGQLVAAVPENVYKGAGLPVYYEFFPTGNLSVAGKQICKKDDDYEPPSIGDRQLVTGNAPFGSEKNVLIPVTPADFVKVTTDGRVAFPRRYVESDSSLEGIDIQAVRSRLHNWFIAPRREP